MQRKASTHTPSRLLLTSLYGVFSTYISATLANFHPWLVRKTVGLAVRTLPTLPVMLERIFGPGIQHDTPRLKFVQVSTTTLSS